MALNITLDGFCSRDSGSLANADVQYQGFFYKVNSGSSASTWNTVRTVEASGYWNINLGDGDWLTQDGSAAAGDRIVIVFWRTGSDRNADCVSMDEWGAFEITLDGSSTYTNPTQTKENIVPDLHWTFPTVGGTHYVDTSYGANNTSEDIHSWVWSTTTMYHWYLRYGQTINYVNRINNSVYDWDDSATTTGTGAADESHQWSAPGIYDVELVVEDECGLTATGTEQIQIFWHPPTCGITMYPSDPDPNEIVYFKFTGTDVDNTITSIDWIINDGATTTTTSGVSGDSVYHTEGLGTDWCGTSASGGAFTNSGSHLVEITIHYNDGFDDQILDCDDTFTQGLFTGPTISFSQDPFPAPVGSGITFANTSTNTGRVGLGLLNCTEYVWTFDDDGVITTYSGSYGDDLNITPTSTNCTVELCAEWSDGFTTQETCVSEGVPFQPHVTITLEDCYYNLNVVGTSNDGTVSGYSWTVWSGAGETGPWTEVWTTPTGIEQNDKKICFTSQGWFKATGYVYGSGTLYDDDTLEITQVCPSTISGAVTMIWNGTGPLDDGTDWAHSGYGTETAGSMYAGTNGLDATNMSKNDKIYFNAGGWIDISYFDMLVFWINIREFQTGKDVEIAFQEHTGSNWKTVNLSSYTNVSNVNETWRKIYIPLADFGIESNMVRTLRLTSTGNIGVWLDDIAFSMGALVGIPVCEPEMFGNELGQLTMTGHELKPSMKAKVDECDCIRQISTFPYPKFL